ncbi:hypothetical protein DM02DRAFT_440428 [Periconia macrospinosa]|uniref:non-specific serine/threonine protein kinase n=1 Tax=Periconia macrospinosa TaxID=97972 RepID=A0A2V1DM78_9PLEO|nr:hypothetical protein DM02DRAFT_440428 [Periconia macrospinosa]
MPAKQVYGRRKPVKSTATFSKFISPDKDATSDSRAKRPTTTAALVVKEGDVQTLEDGLASLRIEDDKENLEINENESAKTQGKGNKHDATKRTKETQASASGPNLNDLKSDETRNAKTSNHTQKKGNPRRAAENKSSVSRTKKEAPDTATCEQTINHAEEDRGKQSSLAPATNAPGRKLKAVLIPRRSSAAAMPLLPTPASTPDSRSVSSLEPEDIYANYVSPLLAQSYGKKIITFKEWSAALEVHFTVSKIAEASFSEVYRLSSASTAFDSGDESVLKLIALKTPPNAPLSIDTQGRRARASTRQPRNIVEVLEEKDQWKSSVSDVHSEVRLLQNLNQIPGFTNFREITVLQGRPTSLFANAWKAWNKKRPKGKKSEFPDPSKKTSYEDNQLWAVVEMQDAGTDCEKVMENGGVSTVWEVWDVFWGVVLSVAKAEETCKFEHRDLHLENICIRSSRSHSDEDLTRPFIKNPLRRKLGFSGLDTTVIDYTLSRADVLPTDSSSLAIPPSSANSSSTSIPVLGEEDVAYLDLGKDPSLFEGDASEEYQYEIYRYMRGIVLYNDPLQNSPPIYSLPDTSRRSPRKTAQHIRFDEEGDAEMLVRRSPRKLAASKTIAPPSDIWKSFHPRTNLVWAHFILSKLLQHLEGSEPTALSAKQLMRNVEAKPSDSGKIVKKASKLFAILEKVNKLLQPEALRGTGSLESVKELVVLAIEERWLRIEDVTGV